MLGLSLSLLAAESPFSGIWKLNLAKSKMTPPHPKEVTVHVDADDNGIKVKEDVVDSQGQPIKVSYEAKFDGKDYPATGNPEFDSVSFQRIDSNTLKAKLKKSGKVIGDYTLVVSKDGKTTSINYTETSPEGKPIEGFALYEKQ